MRSSALLQCLVLATALVAAAPAPGAGYQDPLMLSQQGHKTRIAPTSMIITAPVSSAPEVKVVNSSAPIDKNTRLDTRSPPPQKVNIVQSSSSSSSAASQRLPLYYTSYTTKTSTTTQITGTLTKTSTVTTVTSASTKTATAIVTSSGTTTVTQSTTVSSRVALSSSSSSSSSKASSTVKTTSRAASTTSSKPTSSSSKSTTASTSTTTSTAPESTGGYNPINIVYYPDWTADTITPDEVDYSLYDILYFSFAIPASDFSLYFTQDDSATNLQKLVTNAHAAGSKVCITIGGWTGSQYFSSAVADDSSRYTFATNIVAMVNAYGVDGIDIDWEYPGQNGADGNIVDSSDSDNFLIFVKLLRSMMGPDQVISMATPLNVWYGDNGQPMTDVSAFAPYIDHVLLMNYDVWGSSSTPGPNAPLNVCGDSDQPEANAVNAVAAWEAAGMPASQIILGIPAYGYVSDSTATTLIHKRSSNDKRAAYYEAEKARKDAARARRDMRFGNMMPRLESRSSRLVARSEISVDCNTTTTMSATTTTSEKVFNSGATSTPAVKVVNTDGDLSDFMNSQIEFYQLLQYKALALSTTGVWYGKNGYKRKWDSCSSTPYLYNVARSTVVTYDDTTSIKMKGKYAASQKLRGLGMWDISGDYQYMLTKAARLGLGI